MFCEVAKRMGFTTVSTIGSAQEIFVEHAALSAAIGNERSACIRYRRFEPPQCRRNTTRFAPTRWPVPANEDRHGRRLFADGRFYHADGRARFVATVPPRRSHDLDDEYPLVLNTGRIRDQWHTMTRSGQAPRLTAHLPEPFVDMHPAGCAAVRRARGRAGAGDTRWGSLVAAPAHQRRDARG